MEGVLLSSVADTKAGAYKLDRLVQPCFYHALVFITLNI